MNEYIVDSNSIKAYRHRVKLLGQELWEAKEPLNRMNLALMLADAASTLARMEAEEYQQFQKSITNIHAT